MVPKKTYTPQQILLKAANYCAYQERCYKEVEEKLAEWGMFGTDAGEMMLKLREQNYINEERYAKAFAGGKFRVKKWGRNKIRQALKQHDISAYCIDKGLKEIDEDDYLSVLNELATDKLSSFKEKNSVTGKHKAAQWLIGKGYEANLVWDTLQKIL